MRVFFSLRHPGTLRNFASTVLELAARGHHVHLSFTMQDKLGDGRVLWEASQTPGVTVGDVAAKAPWRFWLRLARGARACRDYLRYRSPDYTDAPSLRDRADAKTPATFRRVCAWPVIGSPPGRRVLGRLLALVEEAIPSDPLTDAALAAVDPDVVLVSPLVDFASDQVDVVKSARALGRRVALCVHSWDNLTNKGLIRLLPDRVFVWNDMQRQEAITMHGVADADVVATGAPSYDQWFEKTPSISRAAFLERVGLPADRDVVLYLCSSPFIAPDEVAFIETWLRALRGSHDPRLREVGVLIRPHPENVQPWHRLDLASLGPVAVWPRDGANPVDDASKSDYFHSLHWAAVAVGVNSSALIEAGIVGRAVYTVRMPQFAGTQDGTLHFQYLVNVNGGLLRVAADLDAHVVDLAQGLADPTSDARRAREFVRGFVRPHGLDVAATPRLVEGIEALAAEPRPMRRRTPVWLLPLRLMLYPFALAVRTALNLERVTRKRERTLRSLTVAGVVVHALFVPIEQLMRWRPAKALVKRHVIPRVLAHVEDAPSEQMAAVRRLAGKLATSDRLVIVGPWMSEVGHELLYWIPFLRWMTREYPIDADRLVVVSRGGVASWYGGIAARYIDLYDYFTPDQLVTRNTQAVTDGQAKLRGMTDLDRQVLKLVQVSLQTRETRVLHPMQMYQLFAPYWKHRSPVGLIETFTAPAPFPASALAPLDAAMPAHYVAVAFTFNQAFPDTPENGAFTTTLLERLSRDTDIVWLGPSPPPALDGATIARLRRIDDFLSPRNSLDVKTRIIAGARGFVGSVGGLAYLASFCGVHSVAFYSDARALPDRHLEVARRAFAAFPFGGVTLLDCRDCDLVRFPLGVADPIDATPGRKVGLG